MATNKKTYPFIEIENDIRESLKETLQKHIVNVLTYWVLNNKDYEEGYFATENDIHSADKIVTGGSWSVSPDNRVMCYKNHLSKDQSCLMNYKYNLNNKKLNAEHDHRQSQINEKLNVGESISSDEHFAKGGSDSQSGSSEVYSSMNGSDTHKDSVDSEDTESLEAPLFLKHEVFNNLNNLQSSINFGGDFQKDISGLIAEHAENIFDSDETILEIINQNSEDIDPAIAELIFGGLYFHRDYSHETILEYFSNETMLVGDC